MTVHEEQVATLRSSEVAAAIRWERLVVVLRRVAPQKRLIAIVRELAEAGARVGAGAVAVGIGGAIVNGSAAERAAILAAVRAAERAA